MWISQRDATGSFQQVEPDVLGNRATDQVGRLVRRRLGQTGPADLASLAGRWEGFGTGPGGASTRTTFGIAPEGRYTAQIGTFTSTGTLRIAEGQLVTVPDGAARGAFATDLGATIEVRERDGGLVLSGDGRSDRGPYSFEVTRRP